MSLSAGDSDSVRFGGAYNRLDSADHDGAHLTRPDVQQHRSGRGFVLPSQSISRQPYKLATACLTAFSLILLLTLVVVSLQYRNVSKDKQSALFHNSTSAQSQGQKLEVNVTALTEYIKTLAKQRDELQKTVKTLERTCLPDWLPFEDSCYFISTMNRIWKNSQEFCAERGGHLAIIHTAEEQTFIWNQLVRGHWNAYWFGISDEKLEGSWQWVDGTELVGGFWEVGEPNNHINEDCGYIVKTQVLSRKPTSSWYDAPCSMSLPFICEKEVPSKTAV